MTLLLPLISCALLSTALLSCSSDPVVGDSGTSATPPIAWSDPATCSDGVAPGSVDGFVRWPYLQDVRTDAAIVAFLTGEDAAEATVSWGRDDAYADSLTTSVEPLRINDSTVPEDSGTSTKKTTKGPATAPEAEYATLHHVELTGLSPGTEYCYRVQVEGSELASGVRFWTAPDPDADATVRFMVIGDMGAGTDEQMMVRDVMLRHAEGVHFILTTGDNAYSDGDWDELHDNVFVVYQELLTRAPMYPTPGNHDYKTDAAAPYLANFFLPENTLREADAERYYSMDWGPMHWTALDTEDPALVISETQDDDERDWLQADLAATDRPWKIAGFHQPAYSGHPTRGVHLTARFQWVPDFEAAGVQLVLQGHDHFYERFDSVREDEAATLAEGGITYVVTAGGGRGLYEIDTTEPHLAVAELRHHFMIGEVDGCTLRMQTIDIYDDVIDAFELDRCN